MSTEWNQLSDHLASTVEALGNSLVRVASGRRRASGVAWAEGGWIVSTEAVLEGVGEVRIKLPGGGEVEADLVGHDSATQLALIHAEGAEVAVPNWDDGESLRVGNLVMAVGRPGDSVQAALGMVQALGEPWRTPMGGKIDRYIEVDGRLPRGFSGGALVDLSGGVLGVNSRVLVRGGATIPTSTVRRVVEAIHAHGDVPRGFLGVAVQPVQLSGDTTERLGQPAGLIVTSVEAGGPGEVGGLLLGDVLLAFDGISVIVADDLFEALVDKANKQARLNLLRAGKLVELNLEVGARGGGGW